MTLKELHEALARIGQRPDAEDLCVVVPTANGGMCHHHMVDVRAAMVGGDWTKGLLMLSLAEPVILHRQFDKPIEDVAKERLEQLKREHAGSGFQYIVKRGECHWRDGFEDGVRRFTLSHGAALPDGDTVPVQRSLLEAIVQTGATEGQDGLRALLAQLGEAMKCQTNAVQEKP